MANLSNINNKFLVTTGGNVLIGQTGAIGSSLLQVTGTSTLAGRVTVEATSAVTNGVVDTLVVKALSSGAITNGFGVGLSFYNENTVYSAVNEVGKIAVVETDTIAIDDKMVFYVKDNNTLAERLTLNGSEAIFTGKITQSVSSGGTAASFTNSDATNGYGVAIQSEGTSNTRYALILRNINSSVTYGGVSTMTNQVGFWGIGASPTGTLGSRLTVGGNASIGTSYTGTAAPSNGLIVQGNVGIGATSPGVKLHIAATGAPDVRIQDLDGTNQYGDRGHNGGITTYVSRNNTSFGSHVFYSADGTTTQARVIFSQDFGTGSSLVTATGAAGSSYGGFLAVSSVATAQMWASDGGLIYIGSRSNHSVNFSVNNQIKMMINTSGNVGIGTTSPETDLMIYDTVNEDPAEPGFATTGMFALNRSGQATLSMGVGANNSFWMSNVNRAFTGPNYYNISLNPLGGRVGVGTTTPSSKLSVFGTQAAIDFQRGTGDSKWEFSSDAARFYIAEMSTGTRDYIMTLEETTGNVGIGETSPSAKLHVKSTANADVIFKLENTNTGTSAGAKIELIDDEGGSGSGAGALRHSISSISQTVGNWIIGSGAAAGQLQFSTVDAFAMIINEEQRVGIGTTSAYSGKLVVKGSPYVVTNSGQAIGGIDITSNASGANTYSGAISFGSTASGRAAIAGVQESSDADTQGLAFFTHGSGTGTADADERMRITRGGDVLFGTTGIPNGTSVYGSAFLPASVNRTVLLQASSWTGTSTLQTYYNPNGAVGSIKVNGSATSFNTSSDYRLKEDLQDFNGLDKVSKIPVYDFKWKTDESRSYGVMAHELQEVLPDAVSGDKDAEEMQGVDYSKIVPLLVKSIQELKAEIELLKSK